MVVKIRGSVNNGSLLLPAQKLYHRGHKKGTEYAEFERIHRTIMKIRGSVNNGSLLLPAQKLYHRGHKEGTEYTEFERIHRTIMKKPEYLGWHSGF